MIGIVASEASSVCKKEAHDGQFRSTVAETDYRSENHGDTHARGGSRDGHVARFRCVIGREQHPVGGQFGTGRRERRIYAAARMIQILDRRTPCSDKQGVALCSTV